jgi:hypothetical protein
MEDLGLLSPSSDDDRVKAGTQRTEILRIKELERGMTEKKLGMREHNEQLADATTSALRDLVEKVIDKAVGG